MKILYKKIRFSYALLIVDIDQCNYILTHPPISVVDWLVGYNSVFFKDPNIYFKVINPIKGLPAGN